MIDASLLQEALKIGAAQSDLKLSPGFRPHFTVPDGYRLVPAADDSLERPFRLQQIVNVYDADSFTKYFTDYCNTSSRIFVDSQKPAIVGVIDYHGQSEDPKPDWAQHRVNYAFRHTREWNIWAALSTKEMKQIDFARFVEDNLPDIVHPTHAEMLQISRTMEAKKNVNFSSGVRLNNGEIQLVYQEEIRGTAAQGTLEIPETFRLRIAPYEGSEPYTVDCRLRYSIKENSLTIKYEMVRPHKILEDSISKVVESIRQGVTNPITFGTI